MCDHLGLRLAILVMLKGVINNLATHFGIKCSSFCRVNVGTSMRSACTAIGFTQYLSVALSNKLLERNPYIFLFSSAETTKHMTKTNLTYLDLVRIQLVFPHPTASRTCTLILLCTALGGAWTLEQPSGSLLEFYPTWRFILDMICKSGGASSVIASDCFCDIYNLCIPSSIIRNLYR